MGSGLVLDLLGAGVVVGLGVAVVVLFALALSTQISAPTAGITAPTADTDIADGIADRITGTVTAAAATAALAAVDLLFLDRVVQIIHFALSSFDGEAGLPQIGLADGKSRGERGEVSMG